MSNDARRRRRSPFDIFGDDWFEGVEREFEEIRRRMLEEGEGSRTYGFSYTKGPDGKETLRRFGDPGEGDVRLKEGSGCASSSCEKLPAGSDDLTDIFEMEDRTVVTLHLPPGVHGSVVIKVAEDHIIITANGKAREIALQRKVDPSTAEACTCNGVLEVSIRRGQGVENVLQVQT